MATPKLSIITICRNASRHIAQCMRSVFAQTYPNIEYIVIDGDSTDGTRAIISAHRQQINFLSSEPDDGIADAMNKGLAAATGQLIFFLHADDYLVDPASVANAIERLDPKFRIHCFDILLLTGQATRVAHPRGMDWRLNFKNGIYHQACFCDRALFDEIGAFDTQFSISMDYDWFLRAYRRGVRAKCYAGYFSVMRTSGISGRLDWPTLSRRFREQRRLQRKNRWGASFWPVYAAFWIPYLPYRRLREVFRASATSARVTSSRSTT